MRYRNSIVLTIVCFVMSPTGMIFGQGVQLTPRELYQEIPTHDGRAVTTNSTSTVRQLPRSVAENDDARESRFEIPRQTPAMRSLPPGINPGWGTDTNITLPSHFDLSEYLPIPGKQSQNDCVAWAIAHAAYSCQIAQERREKPIDPSDQFSPNFLYDQLSENGSGLLMLDVIDFVKQNGCATRATMPLSQMQVSHDARIEARNYVARRNERAATLGQIKTYIYEGYPVVLIVRMGCDFRLDSVLDSPFLWECQVDPNAGYHAITAVGFDDAQQALLIMNSWGTQWKDGGFCWVSYDNFASIDTEGWCAEAHVVGVKRFAPYNVSMRASASGHPRNRYRRRTFQLAIDRHVYESNKAISPDQWVFDDIACSQNNLFALGRDQTVYRMNDEPMGGPSWTHLDNGSIANKKVAMMAGDRFSNLWVLTTDHELYQYDNHGGWISVTLTSAGVEPIDLRSVAGKIHATTADGKIFVHERSGDWTPVQ